ncbi:hypothetical protein NE686_17800 [Tissierella carlieri]|uniref:Uncharacterized protein n=2 Tax=Tissierella carlieri TaxID=689904 RepID=A0ABT1SEX3_9FIRM|nr:hypothetical protein [Tissierella carlieri]
MANEENKLIQDKVVNPIKLRSLDEAISLIETQSAHNVTNLSKMSEEEIIELANDILISIRLSIDKKIRGFICEISNKYPSLKIEYDYDSDLDLYDIWHTDQYLQFNDKNFKQYIAEKAREYLFDNNIYNFSFGYDHIKYIRSKQKSFNKEKSLF